MIYVTNNNIGLTGGGDAVVAMEIINSLHSSGLDVGSISSGYEIPDYLEDKFSGLINLDLPFIPEKKKYSGKKFGAVRYILKKTQSVIQQTILSVKLRKNPPKLIITNDLVSGQYISNKYNGKVKTIHVVHNIPGFYEDLKGEDLEEYFELYNKSDHVVFVSERNRKMWLSYGKLDEKKTSYVYNCANEEFAQQILRESKNNVRKKLHLDPNTFYLVTVASFHPQKGLDYLIEATPELKKIAPNLEILVIGADRRAYKEYMEEKMKEKSIECLKLLGFKSNAMEYIYAADAFILPSRMEGFPLVILESMILKTPVIASKVGGVPEMILHDETGLLFERGNVEELIERFKEMYLKSEDRKRFINRASKKYWEEFSKSKFTEKYLSLVNSISR